MHNIIENWVALQHWFDQIPLSANLVGLLQLGLWLVIVILAAKSLYRVSMRSMNRANDDWLTLFALRLKGLATASETRPHVGLKSVENGSIAKFFPAMYRSKVTSAAQRTTEDNPFLVLPDVEDHNVVMGYFITAMSIALGRMGFRGQFLVALSHEVYSQVVDRHLRGFAMTDAELRSFLGAVSGEYTFDRKTQITLARTFAAMAVLQRDGARKPNDPNYYDQAGRVMLGFVEI